MAELWQIISNFAGKWWWVIFIALAFTVLLFIVVVKLKNMRIRKLKKQLKAANAEKVASRVSAVEPVAETETKTVMQVSTTAAVAEKPVVDTMPQTDANAAQEPIKSVYGATVDESDAYGLIPESEELTEPVQKKKAIDPPTETAASAQTLTATVTPAPKREATAQKSESAKPQEKQSLVLNTVQMDDSFYSDADVTIERVSNEENADDYTNSVQLAPSGSAVKYTVMYDRPKDSWVIKKDGVERVIRRVNTKEEALQIARDLCKKYNANLVVHKKDGRFQKQ